MSQQRGFGLVKRLRVLACCALVLLPALASAAANKPLSITPNFKDASIVQIAQAVAAATGKDFILDPRVHAQVTMFSSTPLSPPAFYQAFLSILEVYGFIAVPAGNNIVKIVPNADAREMPSITLPKTVSRTSDEIVTEVIAVKNVSAAELVPILRPMIPQWGHLAAYPPSNVLIISDRASNVHRMMRIIHRIDRIGNADVDVVPLQNASADAVVRVIDQLYQGQANQGQQLVKVVADDRTNSVLISGDPAERLRVKALIAELDTPEQAGGNTRVVFLHYADAAKLAPQLKAQMQELAHMAAGAAPGARAATPQAEAERNALVWADKQNNALVITAPPKVMRTVLNIVHSLDRRRPEVLVQAIIAEVSVQKTADLGVNWAAFSKSSQVPLGGFVEPVGGTSLVDLIAAGASYSQGGSSAASVLSNADSLLAGTTIGIGTLSAGGTSFAAMLRALQGTSGTNIVSTPSAVTMDNEAATLKDVQEVPFVTGQYTSASTVTAGTVTPFQTVQQQEVGTILKVTPTISAKGNAVMLKLAVTSSSVVPNAVTNLSGDITTQKRSISTNVLIENGGIVVLGGLISNEQDRSSNGVPFLSSIPVFGLLFRARNDQATRDNLMIFIRPTILRDQSEAATATDSQYDYMMNQEHSIPPERFPNMLRGQPAPQLPVLPPPPPPGTLSAPSPLAAPGKPPAQRQPQQPPAAGNVQP